VACLDGADWVGNTSSLRSSLKNPASPAIMNQLIHF
jgi:hypothetical protein